MASTSLPPSPMTAPIIASNIPVVTLNSDAISDTMAARLSSTLVQHILFLKNQTPFPIPQLARLPSGRNPRATKKKEDLLDAVDTLTCHLLTTFSALSTALALNSSRYPQTNRVKPKARADLALILGPSISGARARVLMSVDGLEVKLLGQRDYDQEEEEEEEGEIDSGNEYSEPDGDDSKDGEDSDSGGEQADIVSPPPSPTPSESSSEDEDNQLLQPPEPPAQRSRQPFSPRPSGISQTEETRILVAAERLLSRTLANACAEDDNDLGSEMAPTQTHILIRAPRRFAHPSWIPRQNLTTRLDSIYNDFLEYSGISSLSNNKKSKPRKSGIKTEGVWVRCQDGNEINDEHQGNNDSGSEEDQMIWWSWDGKIIGFSDW